MKRTTLALMVAIGLAAPAAAQNPPNDVAASQQAVAQARAAHVAALKSHDQAAIVRTQEQLRAAYSESYYDRSNAAAMAVGPAKGQTRESQLALLTAKENYRDALASGDKAAIAAARAAVRTAYRNDWVSRHPRHAGK